MLGRGIDQEGVQIAIDKLNHGDWIHVFPEGKVNQSGTLLPFRWGVGKLIAECNVTPTGVPFYHRGKCFVFTFQCNS